MTEPLAHVRQKSDNSFVEHWLEDHLLATAKLAGKFAEPFESSDWSECAGLWHDLGKYSADFQNYIKSVSGYDEDAHIEGGKGRVDHSAAGAIHAVVNLGMSGRIIAYLIAGHHAGLPDWYKLEGSTGGVLSERLQQKEHLDRALGTASISDRILHFGQKPDVKKLSKTGGADGFALWVRMLFSCLVDADFLDTEAFMDEAKSVDRGGYPCLTDLLLMFNKHMDLLVENAQNTAVNRLRASILQECRTKASEASGLYSLTVPTGGGKTLSAMAFALEHAKKHGKARILYVIPYTSIIEQTANTFRDVFGDVIIEHHSNFDPDREDSKSRLAADNWDAPIIVTTNVQFFESLFAARTSRCRKLHNIVNSVVVLDEAQMLPTEFLEPVLGVIDLLSKYYRVTFVLSTATQPALSSRSGFNCKFKGLEKVREIIADPDDLYSKLERVEVSMPEDMNSRQSWETIADELAEFDSVLVIVNTRRAARELHALMPRGTYHLSASLCGQHRSNLIAEIKCRLGQGESIRVVSTQLIEAGVDLDFPVVYRALAGLDSIAQAAGRCNREGGQQGKGKVVVFVPPEPAPIGHLRHGEQITKSLMSSFSGSPLTRELFKQYFERFYAAVHSLDKHKIKSLLTPQGKGDDQLQVQFRTAANRFRLIEDSGHSVIVNYVTDENDEVKMLLRKLKNDGPQRWLMRKLQRYAVNVLEFHFNQLLENHEVREIWPGIYAQDSSTLYHPTLGLLTEDVPLSPESLFV
ncbi:MAG: CRISPR-associated helicase Cas3' [Granulosicoccus sp.]